MPSRPTAALAAYPGMVVPAVEAIEITAGATATGGLSLSYCLKGSLDQLRIPGPLPPGPADGLWEHTCFEAFVAVGDGPAYREFNFSPSGQWAAYGFSGYRQRDDSFTVAAAPGIAVRRLAGRLELDAVLPPDLLPPDPAGTGYRLGLTAVVETPDGGKSYWALAHPGPKPDFHLRDAFILHLAAPDKSL